MVNRTFSDNLHETRMLRYTLETARAGCSSLRMTMDIGYRTKVIAEDVAFINSELSENISLNTYIVNQLVEPVFIHYIPGEDRPLLPEKSKLTYNYVVVMDFKLTQRGESVLAELERFPTDVMLFDHLRYVYDVPRTFDQLSEYLNEDLIELHQHIKFIDVGLPESIELNKRVVLDRLARETVGSKLKRIK